MTYTATQRCPDCHSERTKVRIVEGKTLRGGEVQDVHSVWTCADCGKEFEPKRAPNMSPILMCSVCGPAQHKHIGTVTTLWVLPNTVEGKKPDEVKLNNYRCVCGIERPCGCA
jgi:Zn finger protein HypA/HybF involved in hydrogenase expression